MNPTSGGQRTTIVDIHAHHVATDLVEEAARFGDRYGVSIETDAQAPMGRLVFDDGTVIRPFFPELCDLSVRIPIMDDLAVDVQVVSTWTDIAGYALPDDKGIAWARLQNQTLVESIAEHPGRFEAMATLPLQNVEASVAEMHRVVDELGVRAFEIGTSVNGVHIGDDLFRPVWSAAAELDVFVLLHPPLDPTGTDQLKDYFLKNLLGNPTDTTMAASKLIVSGTLAELPNLKICLSHGGGFLPYQVGRLDKGHSVHPATRERLGDDRPSSYLDRFFYDTIIYDPVALGFLASKVSPGRLMLGSDYPFEMFDIDGLYRIREAGWSEAETQGVLGANASRALQRHAIPEDGRSA